MYLSLVCIALHWRHNHHDDVLNHQPHGCLLNRLFGRRSKKTSKLRVTGLRAGNSPGPVNSPHKGPVTRKIFPFDDVIMGWFRQYLPVTSVAYGKSLLFVSETILKIMKKRLYDWNWNWYLHRKRVYNQDVCIFLGCTGCHWRRQLLDSCNQLKIFLTVGFVKQKHIKI